MEGLHTGPQTGANLTQTSGIMRAYLALKQASGSPFLMSILTFAILSTSLILFGLWLVCKSFLRDDDTRDQLAKKEPPKANEETHHCSGPSPGQKLPRRPAPDVPTSSMMPPGPTPQGDDPAVEQLELVQRPPADNGGPAKGQPPEGTATLRRFPARSQAKALKPSSPVNPLRYPPVFYATSPSRGSTTPLGVDASRGSSIGSSNRMSSFNPAVACEEDFGAFIRPAIYSELTGTVGEGAVIISNIGTLSRIGFKPGRPDSNPAPFSAAMPMNADHQVGDGDGAEFEEDSVQSVAALSFGSQESSTGHWVRLD